LKLLFHSDSIQSFTKQEISDFEQIIDHAYQHEGNIQYTSEYAKYRFLQYVTVKKQMLLHGSNHKNITEFVPRKQTLFNGEYVEAVFSTKDGFLPIFFAVLNRNNVIGSFRNGCFMSRNKRFYYFSINSETLRNEPWTEGIVYILPERHFSKVEKGIVSFDEWISETPVQPELKLPVDFNDFLYQKKIAIHNNNESMFKTWLLYKFRTSFFNR